MTNEEKVTQYQQAILMAGHAARALANIDIPLILRHPPPAPSLLLADDCNVYKPDGTILCGLRRAWVGL